MSLRSSVAALFVLLVLHTSRMSSAAAQSVAPTPSIFAPLTLPPAPSATRLATGAPGPQYWQNRVDYDIQATLDTGTHYIVGTMELRYTNHSPDTLRVLWFQTEQNSEVIDHFDQVLGTTSRPLTHEHPPGDIYEMRVTLAKPLGPGATGVFHIRWHFRIPQSQRDGSLYQIALWYPRLNVYDDVKGWNTESFSTGTEYYLEYGDFRLAITLPASYIVAATGTLQNPQDVLTAIERARVAAAAHSDSVVRIVTAAELESGAARPTHEGMLTWKFLAKNVRDAVWCAAPNYQWDATSWHGILAQAYYRPNAKVWADAADQARTSIQEYSERWYLYPYPQVSVVEGPEEGEEYPMLGQVGDNTTAPGLYAVLTHEVAHNWFPMLVGSNERMHTWMDEGFVTFMQSFAEARRYPTLGDQQTRIGPWGSSDSASILEDGTPIGNITPQYDKTARVLEILRRDIMGPAAFDTGLKTYIRQWAYKHPTPMDFFRTMANAYGHNLDWFWRECFLEAPFLDESLDSVRQTVQGNETHLVVTYGNHGRMVMPLLVRFVFSDNTIQDVTYPAEVWRADPTTYTVAYTFANKRVSRIVVDVAEHFPDVKRSNNVWTAN